MHQSNKQRVQSVVQQVSPPLLHLAGDTVTFEMEKDPVTSLVDINISLGGESYFPQTKDSYTEAQLGEKKCELPMY